MCTIFDDKLGINSLFLAVFLGFNNSWSLENEQRVASIEAHIVNNQTNAKAISACPVDYLAPLIIKEVTPENTVFAFDVHEVLIDRHRPTIVWGGLKLFCKTFFYLLKHPYFTYRLTQIFRKHAIFEGMYAQIASEYPHWEKYKQDFLDISNTCCYPIEPMIRLLKSLKQKGFKLFMLSNMGSDTWEDFGIKFQSIAELFDGFYTPHKENSYVGKPSEEFYGGFRGYLNANGYEDKQILFIDDIEKNIVGAVASGIAGIHFLGHQDLCAKLTRLGLVLDDENMVN